MPRPYAGGSYRALASGEHAPYIGVLLEAVLQLTLFPLNGALPLIREPLGSLGIVASESTGGFLRNTLKCVLGCLTFVLFTALHALS